MEFLKENLGIKITNKIELKKIKNQLYFFVDCFIVYGLLLVIILSIIDISICYFI